MGKFLLWVVILVIIVNTWGSLGCLEEERIALLYMKTHMTNPTYGNYSLVSWVDDKRSDCCKWERVTCSNVTGRVIKLRLNYLKDKRVGNSYINATVFLPFKQLNYIDLEGNNLAGTVENGDFDKLSKLDNLEEIHLDFNNFNRSILSSLSQLSPLKYLYLDGNPLDSSPSNPGQARLSGLSNLEIISMRYTKMEDNNVLSALNLKDFKCLKELDISNNKFQSFGSVINDGGEPKKLESLTLNNNRFNKSIFQWLKELQSLKILDLSANDIHGRLHIQDINALSSLEDLDLSFNSFEDFRASISLSGMSSGMKSNNNLQLHLNSITCNMTKLLQSLAILPSIKSLELKENNITSIEAIHALRNLSNIEELFLDYSYLHKDFLQSIGTMNLLKVLSIRRAHLGSTLPNKGWCELRNLQELSFRENQLEGMLPSCLGNLTFLRYVDLYQNMLTGNIESSPLSSLTSLEYLSISHNSIEVPSSFSSFANHSKLRFILADENYAINETVLQSVVIPKFQLEAFSMSNCIGHLMLPRFLHYQHDLKILRISKNNLEGEFPNWLLENNTKLQELYMNTNAFTGALKFSAHLPNLQLLEISENNLSGEIPNNLSSTTFPNMLALNLSHNLFMGEIPSYLGDLKTLVVLDLTNNFFTGEIPKELLIGCTSLEFLKLSNNNMQGEIIQEFAYLSSLCLLHLDGNNFTGTIPESLSYIRLVSLDISDNNFVGKIPRWMGTITSLDELILSKNHFHGSIPVELCHLEILGFLDLSENNLTGSIPPCLNPSFIRHVRLSKNHLGGQLTRAFFNNTSLVTLDLSHNNFVGQIPSWIGSISKLSILLLKGNKFEGKIPIQVCQLTRVSVLDLSNNQLTGKIPSCLGKISLEVTDEKSTTINDTYLGQYRGLTTTYILNSDSINEFDFHLLLDVALPEAEFTTKGNSYEYEGSILKYMSGIDLSSNWLIGEIPYELGNLTEIRALNLSRNNLRGTIPEGFSKLHNIESLDLSHNKLSGKIPNTILNLNTLEVFSVAYNNLTGATPERKAQFGTFDESSYEGNPYLCGPPLHTSCSNGSLSPPFPYDSDDESEESNGMDLEVFYISFGVSYVIFFLGIVLVLYINPYWRNALFERIEFIAYKWFGIGIN